MFSKVYYSENLSLRETMKINKVEQGQAVDDNIIGLVRFAYWITKATDTLN
jgi:predicted DNA-binding protein YlxM (UPF0122 family)